jgi:hypothetical protein
MRYPGNKSRVPHSSLVFREMWDNTALNPKYSTHHQHLRSRSVESHISRNTSEMWGTQDLLPVGFPFDAVHDPEPL